MKIATYSLITMHPVLDRVDVLCVGLAIYSDGAWKIVTLPDASKLQAVDARFGIGRLTEIGKTLQTLFSTCECLQQARQVLVENRSAVKLHEFEGVFGYETESDFSSQVKAIMAESVMPAWAIDLTSRVPATRRPRIRARLRKQFQTMGILGKNQDDINHHKIVLDYPVASAYGLVAEFSIKNGVMSFTETLDFGVSEASLSKKFVEAQAKCLVMRTARETFGVDTKRHIVISGGDTPSAAPSIDLLSTVGDLYSLESANDMGKYFQAIQDSANAA